jgi:hypothetical protein
MKSGSCHAAGTRELGAKQSFHVHTHAIRGNDSIELALASGNLAASWAQVRDSFDTLFFAFSYGLPGSKTAHCDIAICIFRAWLMKKSMSL